jgi:myo-inositol-1(or 4)-monophosphatase
VVMSPLGGELYTAIKGQGAFLNDSPIKVSTSAPVSDSLLITGFPYEWGDRQAAILGRFERCVTAARGVRRLGAAALDLCHLACGRADAYWEDQLKPWDTAAGALIAREAGATVTNFSGTDYANGTDELLASNGHIHAEMLALLQTTKDAT